MDLETENRLAAMLMEEAKKLRLQAEKEGVHVYLHQPKVRGRPNSRFLTSTVLGVQQANRTVEVNEMWRLRKKELDLEDRLMGRSRDESRCRSHRHRRDSSERSSSSRHGEVYKNTPALCTSSKHGNEDSYSSDNGSLKDEEDRLMGRLRDESRSRSYTSERSSSLRHEEVDKNTSALCTSSKHGNEDSYSSEDGSLKDEEVEKFLHSRVKRGRGAVGSRMDELGPYHQSSCTDSKGKLLANSDERVMEEWEQRVLGPERPPFLLKSREVAKEELAHDLKTVKKVNSVSSKKRRHSKMGDRSKEKSRKKKKEKRSKHGRKDF